jgi:hypothetical protein
MPGVQRSGARQKRLPDVSNSAIFFRLFRAGNSHRSGRLERGKSDDSGELETSPQATSAADQTQVRSPPMNREPALSRCRSCQAPIWWRKNPSGKRQPMDYDLVTNSRTGVPHHATCAAREHIQHDRHLERAALPWWNG